MSEPKPGEHIPLTILLPQQLAVRLKETAEARTKSVPEMVLDLLDRNLPPAGTQRKRKIPYT